jgi:CHAD domain-containing protein
MAYRIDFASPFEEEIRRISAEQLSAAADLLENQPDGPYEAVHDARKHIKRTRALYRLIASADKDFAARENDRLRDIAANLAHLRDAAALAESTRYLEDQIAAGDVRDAIHKARSTLEKRRERIAGGKADIGGELTSAAAALAGASAALDDLQLPKSRKDIARCLARGWERTGRKATDALAACAGGDEEVPYHDLRKRAQDRWMHARLLRALWPGAMIAIQKTAKALVDELGHEHDLAVLGDHVARSRDKVIADNREIILLAILEQRRKLQDLCRDAGGDVFRAGPDKQADAIRLLTKARLKSR